MTGLCSADETDYYDQLILWAPEAAHLFNLPLIEIPTASAALIEHLEASLCFLSMCNWIGEW